MIHINVQSTENFDGALKRFNMKVQQYGLLKKLKEKAHYEKPSAIRRRKKNRAPARV